MYEWDPDRIVALLRAHIRLGYHPARWKVARGVTIPKPGKDDYGLAKSYRCISLLNCLGKMVEKVAAMLVSAHCERVRGFHPGQYGCRTGRSAVDAVGITIAQVQEAWGRGVNLRDTQVYSPGGKDPYDESRRTPGKRSWREGKLGEVNRK